MIPCFQIECARIRGVLTGFLLLLGLVCVSGANTPARADDSCAFFLHEFWETATIDQVEACIRAGEDVNALYRHGYTPLHIAAWSGSAETVTALITAGAEIEAEEGWNGQTPLHRAAEHGNAETVTALITEGAKINVRDVNSQTPLHLAAIYGNAETVTVLISAGALDADDGAAVFLATLHGNAETVAALISAGASNPF